MMKSTAAIGDGTVAVPAAPAVPLAEAPAISAGTCPACNSSEFESILRTGMPGAPRTLIACSRCGLLRFLGAAASHSPATFLDSLHFSPPTASIADRFTKLFAQFGLRSKLRFVATALFRKGSQGIALDLGGDDGTLARALESQDARVLAISRELSHAQRAQHRHGVVSVVADAASPPLKIPMFDGALRLRGFAHDEDPVAWLHAAKQLLRPGGRIVIQAYDSGSWAFLITGSQWAGLEGSSASYAFRAADLEVLLDFCGFRILRRTHFFPFLNASAWVSSLFPFVDPQYRRLSPSRSWKTFPLDLLFVLLVVATFPLALVESVCHAGTVLMVEAEPK